MSVVFSNYLFTQRYLQMHDDREFVGCNILISYKSILTKIINSIVTVCIGRQRGEGAFEASAFQKFQ